MKTKRTLIVVLTCLAGLSAGWFLTPSPKGPKRMGWVADFTDNFNRADGNIANSWTGSFDATFQIASNEVNTLGGTFATVKAMSPSVSKGKQKAQCKMTLQGTTGSSLLCIRQQAGAISQYAAGIGGGILYIFKMNAGTTSVLNNSADLGLASGGSFIVTLSADGSAIQATIAAAATPNTLLATVNTTDSSFATGLQGLAGNVVNSKIDDFVTYEWVDLLEFNPDHGKAGQQTSTTVTLTGATWLSSPPDFSASAGSIVSTNVLTNTTATVVYQAAQTASTTITITDDNTSIEGEFDVVAPYVLIEGDSQATLSYTTLMTDVIAGLTIPVDTSNVSTGAQTVADMIAQIAAQVSPLRSANQDKFVVLLFAGTNDYYLDEATGQEVYDLMCDYADAIHAIGANARVVMVTTPNRSWDGIEGFPADPPDINTRINAGNALILANGDGKFDQIADVNGILNAISTNPDVWTSDGVHLDQEAADAIQPAISAAIDRALGFGSAVAVFMNHYRTQGIN